MIHIINKVEKDCQLHTDQHKNKIFVLNCNARSNGEVRLAVNFLMQLHNSATDTLAMRDNLNVTYISEKYQAI